ncbi:MAG: outer membrane beta-barrel protein [Bacteroidales bacterium]|nr:outer membrane beta-barrel protein [Bacteroidales bacterium]
MKRHLFIIVFATLCFSVTAQQVPENIKRHFTNSFNVFTDIVLKTPDNYNSRAINQGFSLSASYVIPFAKSNFSVAIGGGVSFHNLYSDALPKDALPESLQSEEWGDGFYFATIDSLSSSLSYKKNKLSLTYVDVPVELQYCSKGGFKFSVGLKLSFLVDSFSKYKGTDFLYGTDETVKYKKYDLDNLSSFQLGPIVKVGWKWFHAYANYSFISMYDATAGNVINPISVGISFTPGY